MKNDQKKEPVDIFNQNRINVFLQSGFYTISVIGILGGLGYLADKYLGSFPTLFIIGLVIAYPITQILVYKKLKKFANNKMNNPKNG